MSTKTINLGKVAITAGGKWRTGKSYERLTVVVYDALEGGDGNAYVSLKDNIDVPPSSDDSVWQLFASAGLSIYELCVKAGTFVGTEEEFIAAYNAAVQAASSAAADATAKMLAFDAAESSRAEAESGRAAAETARASAEGGRANAESVRVSAEGGRVSAETERAGTFATSIEACDTATALADEKAALANTAAATADTAAQNANEAAENATAALASTHEELAALAALIDNAGDHKAISYDTEEAYKVCGFRTVISGAGVPSLETIPLQFGIPAFIGQLYIDTSAASGGLYYAVGNSSISDWKNA